MAVFAGTSGKVIVSSTDVAEIESWDLTTERELISATKFGVTGGWRTAMASMGTWSGKFAGRLDTTDTNGQVVLLNAVFGTPTKVSLKLQIDAANYITGDAWIKSVGMKDVADGVAEVDFSFTGDGTPTLTHG